MEEKKLHLGKNSSLMAQVVAELNDARTRLTFLLAELNGAKVLATTLQAELADLKKASTEQANDLVTLKKSWNEYEVVVTVQRVGLISALAIVSGVLIWREVTRR